MIRILGSVKGEKHFFFIDYLSKEIKVGDSINGLLIVGIYDQFHNFLNVGSRGWQVIVEFDTNTKYPKEFNKLPKLKGWDIKKYFIEYD